MALTAEVVGASVARVVVDGDVSEPSDNLQPGVGGGNLIVHWSCDATALTWVESEAWYQDIDGPKSTTVNGQDGVDDLGAMASCPRGSVLKVQTDAGIMGRYESTSLMCVIYDEETGSWPPSGRPVPPSTTRSALCGSLGQGGDATTESLAIRLAGGEVPDPGFGPLDDLRHRSETPGPPRSGRSVRAPSSSGPARGRTPYLPDTVRWWSGHGNVVLQRHCLA